MPVSVVLGLQWGDEGKGKICDLFAEGFEYVLRFQGGNNAGHTLYVQHGGEQRRVVLHLVPSGIFRPETVNLIGPGVVLDLDVLLGELDTVRGLGADVSPERLRIDPACNVIHAVHREVDARYCGAIGTTGRGIGPAYEDMVGRRGLRLCDLADAATVRARLVAQAEVRGLGPWMNDRLDELVPRLVEQGRRLAPFVADVLPALDRGLRAGKRALAEGAQGTLLDVFRGSYPYVTSSSTTLAGLLSYTGIPYTEIDRVYGVFKAYVTRVGNGPFPTELENVVGQRLRDAGREYGSTTGRPRRCGWLDLPLLAYACRINGVTDLVMTKVDVLTVLTEGFEVATEYADPDVIPHALDRARPVTRSFRALASPGPDPRATLATAPYAAFVEAIEQATATPVRWVSLGPGRDDVVGR
jgi:adenylosuccinate synthase